MTSPETGGTNLATGRASFSPGRFPPRAGAWEGGLSPGRPEREGGVAGRGWDPRPGAVRDAGRWGNWMKPTFSPILGAGGTGGVGGGSTGAAASGSAVTTGSAADSSSGISATPSSCSSETAGASSTSAGAGSLGAGSGAAESTSRSAWATGCSCSAGKGSASVTAGGEAQWAQ